MELKKLENRESFQNLPDESAGKEHDGSSSFDEDDMQAVDPIQAINEIVS